MWENGAIRSFLSEEAGVGDLTTGTAPTVVSFSKHDLRPVGSWNRLVIGCPVRFRRTPGAAWASRVEFLQ